LQDTIDTPAPTGYIVLQVRIFSQFSRDLLVYLRVLTLPFIQHEQDTATLFEEKADTKRSFWVRLGYEDAFNVMITYLLYRFQRRLKMFCKIKGLGRK
jgi:hypothetical protein